MSSNDWVQIEIRVRYAETDSMSVAHHSNYFIWFEAARAEYCRVHGIDYAQMERDGYFLPVAEAKCRFKHPARYEDRLWARVRIRETKRSLILFEYQIVNQASAQLIAEGETLQALINRDGKMVAFPPDFAAKMTPPAPE